MLAMRALPYLLALLAVVAAVPPLSAEPVAAILVINEVLYDPVPGEGEWVELYNAGTDVGLGGVTLSDQDGHVYAFPAVVFPSGTYLLLRVGPGVDTDFENGSATLHMGLSASVLNNDGDDLLLEGYGRILDFFSFGRGSAVDPPPPRAPWEGSAELASRGLSLSLHPNGLVDDGPENWRSALPTPGAFNGGQEGQKVLIQEVYYNALRDNEYVVLSNQGQREVDLGGWWISDGEGIWRVRGQTTLGPSQRFLMVHNATALLEDAGLYADACVEGCGRLVDIAGAFRLSNQGDEVGLYDASGSLVDAFHYGGSPEGDGWVGRGAELVGIGQVARRRGIGGVLQDTDQARDWEWNRPFGLGQSFRRVMTFDNARAKPVVSPEDSLHQLLSLIGASRRQVLLSGFKLTSEPIAEALEAASRRGVQVRIALEGSPPGGLQPSQNTILSRLESAGATVYLMEPSPQSGFRRYALHHAKYVVVDGSWVLVGSENFSDNGFPGGGQGNRGWGAVVHSSAVAAWLSEVFHEDWNSSRSDVRRFHNPRDVGLEERGIIVPSPLIQDGFSEVGGRVIISPDNAANEGGILRIFREARTSIDVELFYLRWNWKGIMSPFLEELIAAAERGVEVRLLLDGSSYNLEGKDDNDEATARLNRIARERGLPLKVRIFDPENGTIVKLHNKGFVVDGEAVFVSSINWNYHGVYENREAGLYLRSSELASTFGSLFESDWEQGSQPLALVIQGPNVLAVGREGRFSFEVHGGASIVTHEWDLYGDGTRDGNGPTFSFVPMKEGSYPLILRVVDEAGRTGDARVIVTVLAADGPGLPDKVEMALGILLGIAAVLWFRKLRIWREATNKQRQMDKREVRDTDLGGRD